ncbi:hypothetical protein [Sandaracinus amylolyticus]|uniref:hypothetical protein n=1 Tax=Sandaracinus amylolyticus TaxID=927083 RepID=UPI001F18680E|nr:hypothetical protein [Sandaracinus amylolyticus]
MERPPHVVIASTCGAELLARIRASPPAASVAFVSIAMDDGDGERKRYLDVLNVATIVQQIVEDSAFRQAHWRGW